MIANKTQTTLKIGDVVHTKHPKIFKLTKWTYEYKSAKVVGIWRGYAILRRDKGCAPFLESIKSLEKNEREMLND